MMSPDRPARDTDNASAALRRRHGIRVVDLLEREPAWAQEFTNLSHGWRRLFCEMFGTFLLVTAGAGAGSSMPGRTVVSVASPH